MNLVNIGDLSEVQIRKIWALADASHHPLDGKVAWSFEGNGIRTRTAFIQAFRDLGLSFTELPNLLKTNERMCDLAGYLDEFYTMYVVRESNHEKLAEFASATPRPVINAMSGKAHPCEVLADAYYIESKLKPLNAAKVGLWGPPTNVLRSWYELAKVLKFEILHFCAAEWHRPSEYVTFRQAPDVMVDILVTDGWPKDFADSSWSLTTEDLSRLGNPKLLPTPPFSIGKEVSFDPCSYDGFLGYQQKCTLLPIHRAILAFAAGYQERNLNRE